MCDEFSCKVTYNPINEQYFITGNIKKFESVLNDLLESIKDKYPYFYSSLKESMDRFDRCPAFRFRFIRSIVETIISMEEPAKGGKKIFISHSSKDKDIVDKFIEQILRLGCGLDIKDIVCTSIESTGIRTGQDIRIYLQEHIKACDFVFFMVSKNYMESSICLNEMGASWVLGKKVKPLLFPNVDYKDMGWLYEISKAGKLEETVTLDSLHDELLDEYALLRHNSADWTKQKDNFLKALQWNHQPRVDLSSRA